MDAIDARDTIFALASGRPPAGLAVIRVSGPGAGAALAALSGHAMPVPRRLQRARLSTADGAVLDHALVAWFPAPASFTGEDVAELHIHGGRAVIEAVAAALAARDGLRPAEPGEFTRRAFANGKLDLTQVEALADLVAAETEAQRRQAQRQFEGALGALFEGWRRRLIALLGDVEAAMDFADEDVPADLLSGQKHKILGLSNEILQYLGDQRRGERLRDGFRLAIVGAPNVGKSSLLNALARRDVAIVSETKGTTRDVIEVHLDLGGLPVIAADTAGLRVSADAIETEGVRRAEMRARDADLRLAVFDARDWPELDPATAALLGPGSIIVLNKADLHDFGAKSPENRALAGEVLAVAVVSAKTGAGLEALLRRVRAALEPDPGVVGGAAAPLTRARHRAALDATVAALVRAGEGGLAPELVAEELRLAARALGRVTGSVDVEDVLDRIFAEFCIGK